MSRLTIMSGGQTGADRAALDAAIDAQVPCEGWCPAGRQAEDGRIADRYPLKELASGGYRQRTEQNIIDSDATVIFSARPLSGGTALTLRLCRMEERPCLVIDTALPDERAVTMLRQFVARHRPHRLNIAGPRASGEPGIYEKVYRVMMGWLSAAGGADGRMR